MWPLSRIRRVLLKAPSLLPPVLQSFPAVVDLADPLWPSIATLFLAFIIIRSFGSVFQSVVDTIFLCSIQDREVGICACYWTFGPVLPEWSVEAPPQAV